MGYLFTSESVSEGHPDKVADQIMVSMGGRVTKDAKKPEYWDDGADPVKVLANA